MSVIRHALSLQDRAAMAKIREMAAAIPKGLPERSVFDDLISHTPVADSVSFEDAPVGGVAGWWCRPRNASKHSVILYLHGGAYVLGSARAYRNFASQLAKRAGCSVFIADYALAPERPFPHAVQDAQAAYRGLIEQNFEDIALVRDSAGGGLALALLKLTARAARDGISLCPKAAVAMSPWADLALTGPSLQSRAEADPFLTQSALAAAANQYLHGHDARDPDASPLYGNMVDLPPTQIHVGEDEILFDDARRYAERVADAEGTVQLHAWEGMPHVFATNVGVLQAAEAALDAIGEFLRALPVLSESKSNRSGLQQVGITE
jgi:monoterpene epsilon-lactone hydrolase